MKSRLVVALLAAGWTAWGQGPVATIDISAPESIVVAGSQIQMSAVVRDASGVARPEDTVQWSSSDEKVLTVDGGGLVTAVGLGVAEVRAAAGTLQYGVEIQVIPSRLDVSPASSVLRVGETAQFAATAYALSGEPIAAAIRWEVVAGSGDPSSAASIAQDGVVTALALGQASVRAVISYDPPRHEGKLPAYFTDAPLTIREPPLFRLKRLLTSAETRNGVSLRPTYTGMAANSAGQIAFIGSLDGVATGLLLYDNARFQLLASGGVPALVGGQVITTMGAPSINAAGQVVCKLGTENVDGGQDGGLFLSSGGESGFLLLEGTGIGEYLDLDFFYTSPQSLNDNGDVLFRANHRDPETSQTRISLFTLNLRGQISEVYRSGAPLPGLGSPINIEYEYALDNGGGVLFVASSGARRVLYRIPPGGVPAKVIGIDDAFLGSTIQRIEDLVFSSTGEAAFRIDLRTGRQHLVRYVGGKLETKELAASPHTYAVNGAGEVLFSGTVTGKQGLYRWTGAEFKPVLLVGAALGSGQTVRSVEAAALVAASDVLALVRTNGNDFVVARPSATQPVLFQAGQKLEFSPNLHIRSLVQGVRDGLPHVRLGDPSSLFALTAAGGAEARVTLGDPVAGGASYAGAQSLQESPSGSLYFSSRENLARLDGGLYRYAAGRLDRLVEDTRVMPDRVRIYYPAPLAANAKGSVVLTTGTDQGRYHMYLLRNNQLELILTSTTPLSGIGTLTAWTEAAIDEQDRVMALCQFTDGRSGYLLYENSRWRAVALLNSFRLNGRVVVAAENLRAFDDRFFARMSLEQRYVDSAVVEFTGGAWQTLLVSGERMPSGLSLGYIQDYDVNRPGDVAFVTTPPLSGGKVLGIKRRGELHVVGGTGEQTPEGDFLIGYLQCDLRDDGRLYFGAINAVDHYLVYVAEPL